MLVGIDANEANIKNRVGVNIFAYQIIKNIYQLIKEEKGKEKEKEKNKTNQKNKENQENKKSNKQKRTKYKNIKFRIFLQNKPLPDLPKENEWWKYEVFGPNKFWTWTGLVKRLYLKHPRPNVLFSPSHYGPLFSPIPFAISIMDLGFLRWPKQFTQKDFIQLKYWTKLSAKKADKIFTISEFSKKDILNTYQIEKNKVEVVYPAIDKNIEKENTQDSKKTNETKNMKIDINDPYIIYLGTLKPSKNIKRLIKAFNNLKKDKEFKKLKLLIVGKKGWLYKEIFSLVKKHKLEKQVIFTGFVSEKEKNKLIKNAQAFVLPSLWEGFGIPVLEAMQLGTPVVCSKVASLPEVAGDAAIYINEPKDIEEIDKSLLKVLKLTQTERKELINMGYDRVKSFSWKDSAETVLKNLQDIAKDN